MIGCAGWCATLCSLGYSLGGSYNHVQKAFSFVGYVIAAVAVMAVTAVFVHRCAPTGASDRWSAPRRRERPAAQALPVGGALSIGRGRAVRGHKGQLAVMRENRSPVQLVAGVTLKANGTADDQGKSQRSRVSAVYFRPGESSWREGCRVWRAAAR